MICNVKFPIHLKIGDQTFDLTIEKKIALNAKNVSTALTNPVEEINKSIQQQLRTIKAEVTVYDNKIVVPITTFFPPSPPVAHVSEVTLQKVVQELPHNIKFATGLHDRLTQLYHSDKVSFKDNADICLRMLFRQGLCDTSLVDGENYFQITDKGKAKVEEIRKQKLTSGEEFYLTERLTHYCTYYWNDCSFKMRVDNQVYEGATDRLIYDKYFIPYRGIENDPEMLQKKEIVLTIDREKSTGLIKKYLPKLLKLKLIALDHLVFLVKYFLDKEQLPKYLSHDNEKMREAAKERMEMLT